MGVPASIACAAGGAAGWLGLWFVLGHPNWTGAVLVAAAMLAVHLFVAFYEEPALRKKFGADHEEHRRNVPRWCPRLRARDKPP